MRFGSVFLLSLAGAVAGFVTALVLSGPQSMGAGANDRTQRQLAMEAVSGHDPSNGAASYRDLFEDPVGVPPLPHFVARGRLLPGALAGATVPAASRPEHASVNAWVAPIVRRAPVKVPTEPPTTTPATAIAATKPAVDETVRSPSRPFAEAPRSALGGPQPPRQSP